MKIKIPHGLSDAELVAAVASLAASELRTTAALVAHLAEMEERRLHLKAGYPSLYVYCVRLLRLSEGGAYNRIEAARAATRFPVVLDMLADGRLSLASLRLLAPHMTAENHESLLASAAGKGKRQVLVLLAQAFPRPDVLASIRKLPTRAVTQPEPAAAPAQDGVTETRTTSGSYGHAGGCESGSGTATAGDLGVGGGLQSPRGFQSAGGFQTAGGSKTGGAFDPENAALLPTHALHGSSVPAARGSAPLHGSTVARSSESARHPVLTPLSADRYQVRFTAGGSLCDKLRRAQELLRHAVPDGDPAEVIERALTVLLADLERKKFAATDRPRPAQTPAPGSRTIPAAVKREVLARDDGGCAFVARDGLRCGTRAFLEFHHVVPFALGGAPTADNIQLRCRAHNGYEARVDFGERKVSVAGRRSAAGMRSEGLADSEVEAAGVGARVNSSRDELEQGGPVTAERGERSVEGPC